MNTPETRAATRLEQATIGIELTLDRVHGFAQDAIYKAKYVALLSEVQMIIGEGPRAQAVFQDLLTRHPQPSAND